MKLLVTFFFIRRKALIIFALIFLLSLQVITDSDFGWHMRTGQYILENRTIPKTDIFSFSQPDYPYVYHSWASEVLIFASYKIFGLTGASILFASVLTLAVFILYRTSLIYSKSPGLLLFLWLTPLAHSIAGGRTRVFGFLFASTLYFLFTKFRKENSRLIYLTPLLFLLWVNFHGSFILGIFMLAVLTSGLLLENKEKIKKILWILPLSILATLPNPYFLDSWKQALVMSVNSYGLKNINLDWQPLINTHGSGWIFALLTASLLLGIKIFKIKVDPVNKTLLSVFFVLSLITSRFTIALLVFFAPCLSECVYFFKNRLKKEITNALPVKSSLFALSLVLVLLSVQNIAEVKYAYKSLENYSVFLKTKSPNRFAHAAWPHKPNVFVQENLKAKRVLNDANWGGFMVFFDKNQKVFYYGAMDNFLINGRSFALDYLEIIENKPDSEKLMENYRIDALFLPKNYSLVPRLKTQKDWTTIFEDEQTIIMEKN